jgi:hypothetical protein
MMTSSFLKHFGQLFDRASSPLLPSLLPRSQGKERPTPAIAPASCRWLTMLDARKGLRCGPGWWTTSYGAPMPASACVSRRTHCNLKLAHEREGSIISRSITINQRSIDMAFHEKPRWGRIPKPDLAFVVETFPPSTGPPSTGS